MLWINIARLTWLELWQSRVYRSLLGLAFFSPVMAVMLAALFMADIGKVYMDGIAGISQLLAVVFVLFLVSTLMSRDIFDKICYVLLNPPMTRESYFVGRFLGICFAFAMLLMLLLLSSAVVGVFFLGAKNIAFQSGFSWVLLAQMMYFYFFQYVSLIGVVFFIVSWSSGDAETMLFSVAVLVMSWVFPPVLKAMQNPDVAEKTPDAVLYMLRWLYDLMPHLQGSDISLMLAHGESVGLSPLFFYTMEHLLYALVCFVLGLIIFKRRDL